MAGAAWLALAPWPWLRRLAGGVLAVAAQAASWAVFWSVFQGEALAWARLEPGLLGATLAAVTGLAALIAAPRADALEQRVAAPVVVGLAVSVTAVTATAFTGSLVAIAVAMPVPTLAAAAALRSGGERHGLIGLAAADAVALVAILLLLDDTGSTMIGPAEGAGLGLLLLGAAAKMGAVPGIAAWRLAASEGAGPPLAVAVRAHGVVLASIAGLRIAEARGSTGLAAAAAVLVLVAGASAVLTRRPSGALAAATGVGGGLALFALGLGGTVGARAFLWLAPAFLLSAAVAAGVSWASDEPWIAWRWIGAAAFGVAVLSLVGLPPGGGFPGAWLALTLAWERGTDLWLVGAVAIGIGAAAIGAAPVLASLRPARTAALLAGVWAGALLYLGMQPLRLGLGWLVRVETELGLAPLLGSAGAPEVPAFGGSDLALAAIPAVLVVAAIAGLARGVEEPETASSPLLALPDPPGMPPIVERARARGAGLAVAAAIAAGSAALLVWIVGRGISLGFL